MDKPTLFYRFSRVIVRSMYRIMFRIQVIGADQIPESGGVMLCSNHKSNWDPLTLGVGIERPIRFMAKSELFRIPVVNWVMARAGSVPGQARPRKQGCDQQSILMLQSGKLIGIFPEGARNRGEVGAAKRGAAVMAIRTQAVIVPAAIIGNYKLGRKMKVVYGQPIRAADYGIGTRSGADRRDHVPH